MGACVGAMVFAGVGVGVGVAVGVGFGRISSKEYSID